MKTYDRTAILSLAAAGALWGISVPLTKLALGWLGPAWVTVVRFSVAAPLLGFASRRGLRGALDLRVVLAGRSASVASSCSRTPGSPGRASPTLPCSSARCRSSSR
jgi:drug/metabolite transporter (DMT)-like permease